MHARLQQKFDDPAKRSWYNAARANPNPGNTARSPGPEPKPSPLPPPALSLPSPLPLTPPVGSSCTRGWTRTAAGSCPTRSSSGWWRGSSGWCDLRCTSAAPRLHLGCTSAAPRLHLRCTSAAPPLHLRCPSAAPPLHLRCPSAAPPRDLVSCDLGALRPCSPPHPPLQVLSQDREAHEAALMGVWLALDHDASGYITAGEFGAFMRKGAPRPGLNWHERQARSPPISTTSPPISPGLNWHERQARSPPISTTSPPISPGLHWHERQAERRAEEAAQARRAQEQRRAWKMEVRSPAISLCSSCIAPPSPLHLRCISGAGAAAAAQRVAGTSDTGGKAADRGVVALTARGERAAGPPKILTPTPKPSPIPDPY